MKNNIQNSDSPMRLGSRVRLVNFRHQPMLMIMSATIAGLLVDCLLPIGRFHWLIAIGIAGLSVAQSLISSRARVHSLLLLTGSVAGFHHHQGVNDYRKDDIARFVSDDWSPMIVEAVITTPIERRPDLLSEQRSKTKKHAWQSIFGIEVLVIRDGFKNRPASGRVRIVVDGIVEAPLYGDRLRLLCHMQRIQSPTNPGEFDLRKLYQSRGQLVRAHADDPECITLIKAGPWSLQRMMIWLGNLGQQALAKNMSQETVPLAEALVLGRRQAVRRDIRDQLLETGTIHLLAVSGLHVGIVAVAAMWFALLVRMPRSMAISFVLLTCLAYMLLSGARPPVVRAATLISLFLTGRLLGKRVDPLNALATAGVILFVTDPRSMTQIGTHLSFLAVSTIILSRPKPVPPAEIDPLDILLQSRWARFVAWAKNQLTSLWQFTCMSFWIFIVGLPLVWYSFHIVSVVSIVANLLLWLPLTIALIAGLVTSILGAIWPPLGFLPGVVSEYSLRLITGIVSELSAIPAGHFWLPSPPLWLVLTFYGGIVLGPLFINKDFRRTAMLVGAGLWISVAFLLTTTPSKRRDFALTFIDVGHGTSVLMQLPSGENWLYDAGRLGDPAFAKWPIEAVLWHEGIRRLDGIIISHADADHYNAIEGLASRFKIDRIVSSNDLFKDEEVGIVQLKRLLESKSIPVQHTSAGEVLIQEANLEIKTLHPPEKHVAGSDNANSIVLQINCFGKAIVLPGDLEDPGNANVVEQPKPSGGGVLMAPHHGSLSQDLYPILTWANPSVVVASGGKRAAHPRVINELSETGATVFVTARDGAIRVLVSESGELRVQSWIEDPW